MKNLRKEDLSLHHFIKNQVLQDFIEVEKSIPLNYLSEESSTGSYVYQAQSDMLPLPTSQGRGWVYIDTPTDKIEQSNRVVVHDSVGVVIDSSNYIVDYVDGRIIFASSAVVPAAVDYKFYYVSVVDEWPDVESADVPVVAIGISDFTKKGFQLGGGKHVPRRVDLNIFASNKAERDDLSEIIFDGVYLKSCAYQSFPKATMLDWNGTFNEDYEYATVSGSSSLKFENVTARTISVSLMATARESTMMSDLNRYRARVSFDMFHWEEAW